MALKKDEYWIKEDENGELVFGGIFLETTLEVFKTKKVANSCCFENERPVKVRITKVKE